MVEENKALVLLSEAQRAVEKAKTVQELKGIRDKAEAVRQYAKQAGMGREIQNHCAEVKILAERKTGSLLRAMAEEGKRDIGKGGDRKSRLHDATVKLSDLGLTKSDSSRWQLEASLPEDKFVALVTKIKKNPRKELTSNEILKHAKDERREKDRKKAAEEGAKVDLEPGVEILAGDFRSLESQIPDSSISLIFVDPPYDRKSLTLYTDVAKMAARVLRPGGSLIAYAPHYALPEILPAMAQHLHYHWTCCVAHSGASARLPAKYIFVSWKPLVWFTKGTKRLTDEYVSDLVKSTPPEKKTHDWEQSTAEAAYYIEHLTRKGDIVLDPMCGSGTTLIAGKILGRRVFGIDVDQNHVNRAKLRISEIDLARFQTTQGSAPAS